MKIHQVPPGQPFEYNGEIYKVSALQDKISCVNQGTGKVSFLDKTTTVTLYADTVYMSTLKPHTLVRLEPKGIIYELLTVSAHGTTLVNCRTGDIFTTDQTEAVVFDPPEFEAKMLKQGGYFQVKNCSQNLLCTRPHNTSRRNNIRGIDSEGCESQITPEMLVKESYNFKTPRLWECKQ